MTLAAPSRLGEFDFIATHLRPLATSAEALALSDDAAIIAGPDGQDWVIAKDAIVENVHFRSADPPATIGAKLLGTNLSDLAAMGAEPAFYLTAIARPPGLSEEWCTAFTSGLSEIQNAFGMSLLGGDTVTIDGPLSLSCTMIGRVPHGRALRRSTARAGDRIMVSGNLGDAALGLRVLNGLAVTDDDRLYLIQRYQVPQPRVDLGIRLRDLATACIDVSDGLLADLGHIARASALGAEIHLDALPLSDIGRHLPGAPQAALSGGDDYELLFTIPPHSIEEAEELSRTTGVRISEIGIMQAGDAVTVLGSDGQAVGSGKSGWQHA